MAWPTGDLYKFDQRPTSADDDGYSVYVYAVVERTKSLVKGDLVALSGLDAASAGCKSQRRNSDSLRFSLLTTTRAGRATTATAAAEAATATTATGTTAATTTAAKATVTATEATVTATEATTATAEATTLVVVVLGRGVVQPDATASELLAGKAVVGGGSHVNGAELDVAEALGGAGLTVGGETDRDDVAELAKGLVDLVLGDVKRERADPEGLGGSRLLVVEDLGAALSVGGLGLGGVDADRAAVNLRTVLLQGLGSSVGGNEVDVAETTRLAGLAVKHDTGTDDLTAVGELGGKPVVVNVPRETTDEDRVLLALNGLLNLGLLGGGLGVLLSLALAVGGGGLGLLLRLGVRVRVRRGGGGGLGLLLGLLRVRVRVRRVRVRLLLGGLLLSGGLLILGLRVRRVRVRRLLLGGSLLES
jgi:hypothetical protein